jgi:hypothetical protein
MLQNESAKFYFTERFELRGHRSDSFHQLEKGSHAYRACFLSPFLGESIPVSFMLHLSQWQRNTLPNYLSQDDMSKKHETTFPMFQLKVRCEG